MPTLTLSSVSKSQAHKLRLLYARHRQAIAAANAALREKEPAQDLRNPIRIFDEDFASVPNDQVQASGEQLADGILGAGADAIVFNDGALVVAIAYAVRGESHSGVVILPIGRVLCVPGLNPDR